MKFLLIAAIIGIVIHYTRKPRTYRFTSPKGQVYNLFLDMLKQPHLLIAGATGSGKSVVINGLIDTLMYRLPFDKANGAQLILIDPKKVELSQYKFLPHTLAHAAGYDPDAWVSALQRAVNIMDSRYNAMAKQGLKLYTGSDVFVVIDEWASIYKSVKGKECYRLLMRLTSEGRAARVHVILATQVPKATIIPTEIRENFAARLCLRTANSIQSRVIMEEDGCEALPRYGQGFYVTPEGNTLYNIPYVQDEEINANLAWWKNQMRQNHMRVA
jgi:S-DNA-T family DNA segregation ATPase FtsK/SpoIIIE